MIGSRSWALGPLAITLAASLGCSHDLGMAANVPAAARLEFAVGHLDSEAIPMAATCGAPGLPECPLQAWMKASAGTAMAARDATRLERVFVRIAAIAPPSYAKWDEIARDGAAAAKKSDIEGCRRACKACHDEHRARYRAERRDAPVL